MMNLWKAARSLVQRFARQRALRRRLALAPSVEQFEDKFLLTVSIADIPPIFSKLRCWPLRCH